MAICYPSHATCRHRQILIWNISKGCVKQDPLWFRRLIIARKLSHNEVCHPGGYSWYFDNCTLEIYHGTVKLKTERSSLLAAALPLCCIILNRMIGFQYINFCKMQTWLAVFNILKLLQARRTLKQCFQTPKNARQAQPCLEMLTGTGLD